MFRFNCSVAPASSLALLLLVTLACGGADQRDSDRTSPAARAEGDVMANDTTATTVASAPAAGAAGDDAVNGGEVYTRCAVCHQATGLGMPGAYPPLAGSEWLTGNPEVPIRIVLHGLQGAITVKGASYNNAMMAFADQLSDAQIAAVISYERSSWGNNAAPITAAQVASVRAATRAQTTPWNPADLQPLLKQ